MALRFWINGGTNHNWNDTSNWSLTSGGAGGQAVPTNLDDVTLDNLGNTSCILNAAAVCKSFMVASGYTSTVTFTNTLTVSGNLTLGANMVFAGAAAINVDTTGTITGNGKTCPQPLNLYGASGTSTLTFAGNWTNSALVALTGAGTASLVLNKTAAEKIYCQAGLSIGSYGVSGTIASVTLSGTGSFTTTGVNNFINGIAITIDASGGTVTIPQSFKVNVGTLAYVSGTVLWTNGAQLTVGTCTLDNWNAYPIPAINFVSAATVTVATATLVCGTINLTPTGTNAFAGSFGFTAQNVNCAATATHQLTLAASVVYTVTSSFAMGGASTFTSTIASSSGSVLSILTLKNGCAYDLSWCTINRIDCSNGQIVYAPRAVLTTTVNIITTAMPLTWSNTFATLLSWGNGQQNNVLRVKLYNIFGGPITGLAYNSAGLSISTLADSESAATVYTQAGGTIENVTTLGTFATPTATRCRFREVDAANHPGVYEVQLDNARYAVAGSKSITVAFSGAMFLAQGDCEIELVAYKPQDPSLGLLVGTVKKNTAFPNFAFPMFDSGGLLKTGLSVTASLRLDGGSFAGTSGSVTEIGSSGWYTVNLLAAETNASVIAFSATATGAVPTCNTIITQS